MERRPPPLRLTSAVMFVTELDRSVRFYEELLGWHVSVRDNTVALLVSPLGFELYLRDQGPHTQHPLGQVGVQYLMWTAADEDDLRRCERVLQTQPAQVTRTTGNGFTVVQGSGPDQVPILVAYPGPDQVPREAIIQRVYE